MKSSALMEAAAVSEKKPKLLDRVRSDLRVKHYSTRTEKAYIDWIRRFILFHGKRHPTEMGEKEISAFLTHVTRSGTASRRICWKTATTSVRSRNSSATRTFRRR